jgi:hypothetical protein
MCVGLDTHIENLPTILQVLLGLLVIDVSLWIRHSFVRAKTGCSGRKDRPN